jgi:hypothetical protein
MGPDRLEFDVPDIGVLDFTQSPALREEGRRILESKKADLVKGRAVGSPLARGL